LDVVNESLNELWKFIKLEMDVWNECGEEGAGDVLWDCDVRVKGLEEKLDFLVLWGEVFSDLRFGSVVDEILE
jgi:hypothetical protein